MVDDITPSQVSSAEYTAGVQLEMFPFRVFVFLVQGSITTHFQQVIEGLVEG